MKIVVIEDQTMIRELLVLACQKAQPSAEVASASNGSGGLDLCRRLRPQVVILDLVLPDADGLNLAADILKAAPAARIIALSSHTDEVTLHRAFQSCVHGFVDKNEQTLDVLTAAIEAVLDGRQYYSSVAQRVQATLKKDPVSFSKILSDREQELLALFGRGLSNEAVAETVRLSPATVKNHRRNILSKLGLHSTPQLIQYAMEKGFVRV